MHVVITGGTGLIGARLADTLRDRGDDVTIVSRSPGGEDTVVWDPKTPGSLTLPDDTDAVVHLAGAPLVGRRWDEDYKREIHDSRVMGTRTVRQAIRDHGDVDHLVSASAVGYYGDRGDEPLPEDAEPGEDFMAEVCTAWEDEARELEGDDALAHDPAVIRTGVVLAREDGALPEMLNPFWFVKPFHWGMGGRIGDGQQWFPWIHIEDEVRAVLHLLDERCSGPFNLASPGVVRNAAYTDALGSVLGRPTPFPVPVFALRMMLGEVTDVLTASQRIQVDRLQETGFEYEHEDVGEALADLLD